MGKTNEFVCYQSHRMPIDIAGKTYRNPHKYPVNIYSVLLEFGIPMGKTNEFAYYQSRRMPLEYVLNLQIGPAYIALLSRITRF